MAGSHGWFCLDRPRHIYYRTWVRAHTGRSFVVDRLWNSRPACPLASDILLRISRPRLYRPILEELPFSRLLFELFSGPPAPDAPICRNVRGLAILDDEMGCGRAAWLPRDWRRHSERLLHKKIHAGLDGKLRAVVAAGLLYWNKRHRDRPGPDRLWS